MSCLTELLNILNLTTYETLESAHESLIAKTPENIRIIKEKTAENATKSRFLLNVVHKGSITTTLHSEANGIILLFDTSATPGWSTLVIPPRTLTNVYNREDITSKMDKYTIQAVSDGTTVSLYYYDDLWRISTSRGFDMGEIKWTSDKTYNEILNIILNTYDVNYSMLDTKLSYNLGFHHPEYHPFEDKIYAWSSNIVGIPPQAVVSFPPKMTNQQILQSMLNHNDSSINDYFKNGVIHYGYILRHDDDNICLESKLFRAIKEIYYKQPKFRNNKPEATGLIQNQLLNPNVRNIYVALRAYMNHHQKYVALNLFPNFRDYYSTFDNMFNELAINVLLRIQNSNTEIKSPLINVINLISKHIISVGGFNPNLNDSKSIVVDFLNDNTYIYAYVNYLANGSK
jgi:hypothetical protein